MSSITAPRATSNDAMRPLRGGAYDAVPVAARGGDSLGDAIVGTVIRRSSVKIDN
ncbi:MAG TPA: hypothetical protein VHV78_00905 [Gemmatimonadaceae bacterium]|jgi:hypothetical protein|nr:hypothetical protein [Gemmatimonadaceae bacterium]